MNETLEKDELYQKLHKAALKVSFYNAAEGVGWGREELLRRKAYEDFQTVVNEFVKKYGQTTLDTVLQSGNYLLIDDYIV